jgi:uncharacterized low-complexity protein
MSNSNQKPLATLIGATLVTSLSGVAVNAAENPFALSELSHGYMQVAENAAEPGKAPEQKCGTDVMKKNPEMKCGAGMMNMNDMKPAPEQKATEMKCAGMKKDAPPPAPAGSEPPKAP